MDFSRHSSKKFIDYFNDTRKNRYGYEGVLPAEFSHEYNRIAKDWQRKIITIEYNEDLIIMVLKRVQMFKTVYTRVEGLPISINNNCKNERTVLLKLIEKNLINKISSNSSEAEKLKDWGYTLSEKIDSYNFYSHIPSNCEKISKNKWRTKKGINRMLKMSNLKWKVLKEETDEIEMIDKTVQNSILNDGCDLVIYNIVEFKTLTKEYLMSIYSSVKLHNDYSWISFCKVNSIEN